MIGVGINGFGRIGRVLAREILNSKDFYLVKVNDIYDKELMLHLLKHDSVYGNFDIPYGFSISNQKDIKKISWEGVDVVIESSGVYTKKEELGFHLKNGAKKVILTAYNSEIPTSLIEINDKEHSKEKIVSASSCTGNCTVKVVNIIDKNFGIKCGHITTIHSYTTDQNLLDNKNRDTRRGRGAPSNIIPISSNVANAITQFHPHLKGKLSAKSLRVPTLNGVLCDINLQLKNRTHISCIKSVLEKEKGSTIDLSSLSSVSSDITNSPYSAIIDKDLITLQDGNLLKIMLWQDNERGYAKRVLDVMLNLHI